jgi:two-component system, chemotaxis family, CheB/CheR fusion protein
VLSGSGTEGSLGARAIKAEGGLVIAQSPETAVQPGMPNSVIATGAVDAVLAPEKIPAALLAHLHHAHADAHARPAASETAGRTPPPDPPF